MYIKVYAFCYSLMSISSLNYLSQGEQGPVPYLGTATITPFLLHFLQ